MPRETLGTRKELPTTWQCTWCKYKNVRQWAGLDRCSVCGAIVMTRYVMDNELEVRFSQRPWRRHLDCQSPVVAPLSRGDLRTGKISTETFKQ